jgi:hypothetical protein
MSLIKSDFKDADSYVYLSYSCISYSTKLITIASKLACACIETIELKRKVNKDFESAFNVILTSLEVSGAYGLDQWIRIVTDPEVYGGKGQRSPAHTRQVLRALSWLISNGYLARVDGRRVLKIKNTSKNRKLPCAYVITEKWRTEISPHPISMQSDIFRNPLNAYVQLRTKLKISEKGDARSVTLRVTPETRSQHIELIDGTERLLEAADCLWKNVTITLGTNSVPSMQASMTRIFNNGSFHEGGRFYSPLQNLRKVDRQFLRFDGDPTIEVDFAEMHPSLMYHLEGQTYFGDAYSIPGFDREKVKVAFNTMINRDAKKHKGSIASTLAKNLSLSQNEALELERGIYRLHDKVASKFNTGYGLTLQNIDSKIAYKILTYFIMKLKRPILMVHDSAIVSVRDLESLMLAMVDCYKETLSELLLEIHDSNQLLLPQALKVTSQDFGNSLTEGIYKVLNSASLTNNQWDLLINHELSG